MHADNTKKGVSAVEMLVGISIFSVVLIAASATIASFVNTGKDVADKTEALYLAEEALELVRFIRDKKWEYIQSLADSTTYYLDVTGVSIATSTSPEVIGMYTRSFEINPVERNGSYNIVSSGSADPNSKYVTATVTWGSPTESVSLTTIIADINNP